MSGDNEFGQYNAFDVTLGGDRALNGNSNWAAYSHQELYDAVHVNADPATAYQAGSTWMNLGDTMGTDSTTLSQKVAASAEGWRGEAADNAREALTKLSNWGQLAGVTSNVIGQVAQHQAGIVSTAQNAMPEPLNVNPDQIMQQAFTSGGLPGLITGLNDVKQQVDQANSAHASAVDVMNKMETDSKAVDQGLAVFEAPPQVVAQATPRLAGISPRQAGTPVTTPAGATQPNTTTPSGATVPSSASPNGQPATLPNGQTQPAGQVQQPTGQTQPQSYGYSPAATTGGPYGTTSGNGGHTTSGGNSGDQQAQLRSGSTTTSGATYPGSTTTGGNSGDNSATQQITSQQQQARQAAQQELNQLRDGNPYPGPGAEMPGGSSPFGGDNSRTTALRSPFTTGGSDTGGANSAINKARQAAQQELNQLRNGGGGGGENEKLFQSKSGSLLGEGSGNSSAIGAAEKELSALKGGGGAGGGAGGIGGEGESAGLKGSGASAPGEGGSGGSAGAREGAAGGAPVEEGAPGAPGTQQGSGSSGMGGGRGGGRGGQDQERKSAAYLKGDEDLFKNPEADQLAPSVIGQKKQPPKSKS
jgi:hypothetical protein